MGPNEASEYRARCARANYLAQDRSDIQFATKEMSKRMASPTITDDKKAQRLARYLHENPRVSVKYVYQTAYTDIDVWTDTDYAGDKRSRKSTSGV